MAMTEKNQRWVAYGLTVPQKTSPGVVRRILAYSGDMMCVENRFEKGSEGSAHSHPHTQITYIVEGEFAFTIGGETRTVGKGDSLLMSGGVEHGCVCLKDGKLIDIFSPMREDFV